jgi:hypothetical protein
MTLNYLRLYENDYGEPVGYDSEDIEKYMKGLGLLDKWNKAIADKHFPVMNGHLIIYVWEVTSFLGEPEQK